MDILIDKSRYMRDQLMLIEDALIIADKTTIETSVLGTINLSYFVEI